MSRAVNVSIMTTVCRILNSCCCDSYATCSLFRSLINLFVCFELCLLFCCQYWIRQHNTVSTEYLNLILKTESLLQQLQKCYFVSFNHDKSSCWPMAMGQLSLIGWLVGWLVLNGIFSTNRLYHATDVSSMLFRAADKHIITQIKIHIFNLGFVKRIS